MATQGTTPSHKVECVSYAYFRAEGDLNYIEGTASDDQVNDLAVAYLSDGTVTCICSELPP